MDSIVGMIAGALAVYWRPDSEGYTERFLKAVIPLILAVLSMSMKG